MIDPPRRQNDYDDRQIDCQEAMEATYQAMIEAMMAGGWHPDEIERAVIRLTAAARMTRFENARVEADLAIIRAMERAKR